MLKERESSEGSPATPDECAGCGGRIQDRWTMYTVDVLRYGWAYAETRVSNIQITLWVAYRVRFWLTIPTWTDRLSISEQCFVLYCVGTFADTSRYRHQLLNYYCYVRLLGLSLRLRLVFRYLLGALNKVGRQCRYIFKSQ